MRNTINAPVQTTGAEIKVRRVVGVSAPVRSAYYWFMAGAMLVVSLDLWGAPKPSTPSTSGHIASVVLCVALAMWLVALGLMLVAGGNRWRGRSSRTTPITST